jgi:hypothetical protein
MKLYRDNNGQMQGKTAQAWRNPTASCLDAADAPLLSLPFGRCENIARTASKCLRVRLQLRVFALFIAGSTFSLCVEFMDLMSFDPNP